MALPDHHYEAWLIDLDGTLVDSAPDLHAALAHTLARAGLPPVEESAVRRWVGTGARRLIEQALHREAPDRQPDPDRVEAMLREFLDFYESHIVDRSRLYDGVAETLAVLAERGVGLACVTNKYEHLSRRVLSGLGIDRRFATVIGGDTLASRKPDPEPLLEACRRLGVEPAAALMVGDSVTDVTAARAAAMTVACVTYGYDQGRDVRNLGADVVVDSLEALL